MMRKIEHWELRFSEVKKRLQPLKGKGKYFKAGPFWVDGDNYICTGCHSTFYNNHIENECTGNFINVGPKARIPKRSAPKREWNKFWENVRLGKWADNIN